MDLKFIDFNSLRQDFMRSPEGSISNINIVGSSNKTNLNRQRVSTADLIFSDASFDRNSGKKKIQGSHFIYFFREMT